MPLLSLRALPVLSTTLALFLLTGCPSPDGAQLTDTFPDQASACPTDILMGDSPTKRTVELGTGLAEDFKPYSDGQEIRLFEGDQGFIMITPTIRVQTLSGDGAAACYRVHVVIDYQGAFPSSPEPADQSLANVRFVRQGDKFVSNGALYAPTTYSAAKLDGLDVKLAATIQGPNTQGETTLHVTLRE